MPVSNEGDGTPVILSCLEFEFLEQERQVGKMVKIKSTCPGNKKKGLTINNSQEKLDDSKRVKQLFYNKKNKDHFKFKHFNDFSSWYKKQYEAQSGCCYYCKTEQSKITELIKEGVLKSKRFLLRGLNLEIERKASSPGDYSRRNCVLSCYFCNNDKSDIFSEKDYFKYFVSKNVSAKKRYIDDKYRILIKSRKLQTNQSGYK